MQVFSHGRRFARAASAAIRAEAAKHPPLVREHDGVITQYWRDGGEVRCREVEAGEEPEMEALLAAVESEFGRSLPRLRAELRGDGVPDLDALETSIREKMLECGAKACKALLEAYGAELPAPPCATCGERMEQSARAVKGFLSRLGLIDLERIQFHCRSCRVGLHPLDRALDLAGRNATPGAESICADTASSDSYEAASRKLKNLAGVDSVNKHPIMTPNRRAKTTPQRGGFLGDGQRVAAGFSGRGAVGFFGCRRIMRGRRHRDGQPSARLQQSRRPRHSQSARNFPNRQAQDRSYEFRNDAGFKLRGLSERDRIFCVRGTRWVSKRSFRFAD